MRIINLTPHEVKIVDGGNNVVAVFPSDGVARVSQYDVLVDEINSDRKSTRLNSSHW